MLGTEAKVLHQPFWCLFAFVLSPFQTDANRNQAKKKRQTVYSIISIPVLILHLWPVCLGGRAIMFSYLGAQTWHMLENLIRIQDRLVFYVNTWFFYGRHIPNRSQVHLQYIPNGLRAPAANITPWAGFTVDQKTNSDSVRCWKAEVDYKDKEDRSTYLKTDRTTCAGAKTCAGVCECVARWKCTCGNLLFSSQHCANGVTDCWKTGRCK